MNRKCVKKQVASRESKLLCLGFSCNGDGLAKMPVAPKASERKLGNFPYDIGFLLRDRSDADLTTIWLFIILGDLDEEDGCPPDLEAVEEVQVQQQVQQQQQVVQQQQVHQQQSEQEKLNQFLDSDLIRNLTIAIKVRNYPLCKRNEFKVFKVF